jgi:hypothetical protein
MDPALQALAAAANDTTDVQLIDTSTMAVYEWEAAKAQYARLGYVFNPHIAVLSRPVPPPVELDHGT